MAVTENTYTGDGTTVLFSFTFPYLETTDIKVTLNGVITTAYTLANATTIQFNTAPTLGTAIRIYRDTDDADLSATFYPGSAIRSQDLNDNFTQNLYIAQETENNVANAVAGQIPDNTIGTSKLVDQAVTAAKIADNVTSSKFAFLQSGAGATSRTVENKLKDVVSVKDFGAVGDGVADDTTAFANTIASLPASGGTIYVPAGSYRVLSSVNPDSKALRFITDAGATLNGQSGWSFNVLGTKSHFEGFSPSLNRNILRWESPTNSDYTLIDRARTASYTGGTGGDVSSIVRNATVVNSTVGSLGNRKAEKCGVDTITSNSDHANAVARMVQAVGNAAGAVWSLESNTISNVVPTTYAHRSAEFNIEAVSLDTNELRWVIDVVANTPNNIYTGNDSVFAGVHISPNKADFDYGCIIREYGSGKYKVGGLRIETSTAKPFSTYSTTSNIQSYESAVSTANGVISRVDLIGNNSSDAATTYCLLKAQVIDNTAGAEDGAYTIQTMASGSLTDCFRINGSILNSIEVRVDGNLKRVSEGAVDSGGTGFKVLRVPN